jgi:hypothetical protein
LDDDQLALRATQLVAVLTLSWLFDKMVLAVHVDGMCRRTPIGWPYFAELTGFKKLVIKLEGACWTSPLFVNLNANAGD